MRKETASEDNMSFDKKHPRLSILIGLLLLLIMAVGGIIGIYCLIRYIGIGIKEFVDWISNIASTLDAVVIVALITGAVSIVGVIISSIVAKSIDYRKARREYLAQKREKPYSDFIAMYYKILTHKKTGEQYSQEDILKDMTAFSQELTLWGSNKVVKLWVDYRTRATQLKGVDNLFEYEKILYEVRKDMGFRKMKKGTLLKFFVNDLDDTIQKMKSE